MEILLGLLYNFSILVSISIISGFLGYNENKDWKRALIQGLLFGTAAVLGMLQPLVIMPGLIFDGRSVMISLSGLFYGPLTVAVAGSMAIILRIQQGGIGTALGVSVITASAIIGLYFHYNKRGDNGEIRLKDLLLMGVSVHLTMLLLLLILPAGQRLSTIKLVGLPVIVLYPLATVFIGQLVSILNARRQTVEALKKSEKKLKDTNQELKTTMGELVAIQEELRSQYDELETNTELLRQSEATLRVLFEGSSDAILIMDNLKYIDCNQATIELLSYPSKEHIIGKGPWEISPEKQPDGTSSRQKATEIINRVSNNKNVKFEWWHKKQDGTELPVEIMLTPIMLNNKQVFHILWRDISERKQLEQKLEHLSYHDQLTGLYNRRYFEEELKRLDVERNFPLTIVMADVNGLKLINDTFGHYVGDELLKRVAEAMVKGCRADEIIARLGGDEFVILLPKVESHEAEQIVKRIRAEAKKEKVGSIDISISFGWETKCNPAQKIPDILKTAEDRMYQKKLFESPSIRGKTIKAMINTLHEKNKREEQHSHRVSAICERIGMAVELTEGELEELKTAGSLHDIGKIALEEKILNKSGMLTEEEWQEIKRHPEIGYRILNTVNDMAAMAELVLAHHERWDGRGYPKGLKEEEIPYKARIIAIADAYDAMTSERSYRKVLTEAEAIEEIKRNAGSQFDPELVEVFLTDVFKK